MIKEVFVQAPNSLILVSDPSAGNVPTSMAGGVVAATGDCIAVGTLAEFDGETRVRLVTGDDDEPDWRATRPAILAFDGCLSVPGGVLVVANVFGDVLLDAVVGVPSGFSTSNPMLNSCLDSRA